jgi:multimeric flavodoxin WrbA
MKVKVVGIYGSPRKEGNSDLLLDSALRGAHEKGIEVERIYVRDLEISGCIECGACEKSGTCAIEDDMQDVYHLLDSADVIILCSPIFFYGLTSQVKALIDRGQAMWSRKKLSNGKSGEKNGSRGRGYLIAVGATRGRNLFKGAQMIARYFFDALNIEYSGGLFFPRIESKGAVEEHPEALQNAYDLGKAL